MPKNREEQRLTGHALCPGIAIGPIAFDHSQTTSPPKPFHTLLSRFALSTKLSAIEKL